jgi:hypothetical protein
VNTDDFVRVEEFTRVLDYLQTGAGKIGAVESTVVDLKTGVRKLERIVTDGNGQPSLISQITRLQEKVNALELEQRNALVKQAEDNAIEDAAAQRETKRADRRATFWQTVISAAIAAAAVIVVEYLKG